MPLHTHVHRSCWSLLAKGWSGMLEQLWWVRSLCSHMSTCPGLVWYACERRPLHTTCPVGAGVCSRFFCCFVFVVFALCYSVFIFQTEHVWTSEDNEMRCEAEAYAILNCIWMCWMDGLDLQWHDMTAYPTATMTTTMSQMTFMSVHSNTHSC